MGSRAGRLGIVLLVGVGMLSLASCVADPPPVIGTAVPGDTQATVSWDAPPGDNALTRTPRLPHRVAKYFVMFTTAAFDAP